VDSLTIVLRNKFSQIDLSELKFTFITNFIFGLIAHAYCFFEC